MAQPYVYLTRDLTKIYPPHKEVLKDINLSFLQSAKIGIIGKNGSGKSSLLRIMAGLDTNFIGEAFPAKGIKVGYLPQQPDLDLDKTVYDIISEALADSFKLLDEFNQISTDLAEVEDEQIMNEMLEKQADLQQMIDTNDLWDIDRKLKVAMEALGCPEASSVVRHLSGGEKRRVVLCRLLLEEPDLLLLDEPTNHLDAFSVAWLQNYLINMKSTVVLVTHDRYFLNQVTNWILEIEHSHGIPFVGNYSAWLTAKQKNLHIQEKANKNLLKQLEDESNFIGKSQKGAKGKSKARLLAYDQLTKKAENMLRDNQLKITIPPGKRLPQKVLEVKSISLKFQDRQIIQDLSFNLPNSAILGIIGRNGSGKSSLLKLISGKIAPDSGKIEFGDNVEVAYIDQETENINPNNTVWQEISDGLDVINLGKNTISARAYTALFNFKGPDQQKKVSSLSGGELNRMYLAKLVKSGANLLLLDEPTNDLDIETLRSLEEAINEFAGSVIVVSHDRWFLNRIATHILAFEPDGQIVFFEGNFFDYEAAKNQASDKKPKDPTAKLIRKKII